MIRINTAIDNSHYLRHIPQTMVIIVMGLPGSGKSFFAEQLASGINAEYISTDRLRKTMISNRTYSQEEKESVYNEMLKKVKQQNRDTVLDGTFYKNDIREKFKQAGNNHVTFIEVQAQESLIQQRLKEPRKDSEADFNIYKLVKKQWEPLQEAHLILQSTNNNINAMLQSAINYLENDKRPDR